MHRASCQLCGRTEDDAGVSSISEVWIAVVVDSKEDCGGVLKGEEGSNVSQDAQGFVQDSSEEFCRTLQ